MYPEAEQLAHIVGYVAPPVEARHGRRPALALPGIRVGRAGIERDHDLPLRGTAGAVQLEVNAVGRVIRELDRQEGVPGEELGLTVDAGLQQTVRAGSGREHQRRGAGLPATARCWPWPPTFLRSERVQCRRVRRAMAGMDRNRATPLINKATDGLYAPGSTFKMVVGWRRWRPHGDAGRAGVLSRPYGLSATPVPLLDRKVATATSTCAAALKDTCDIYFYEMAKRIGINRIAAMARRFGLGIDLDIELPGARRGLVPTREWRIGAGQALEPRRYDRARHRPGLLPAHAAGAGRL